MLLAAAVNGISAFVFEVACPFVCTSEVAHEIVTFQVLCSYMISNKVRKTVAVVFL